MPQPVETKVPQKKPVPDVIQSSGQIGIQAPVGVPVAPRQPSQRFFPTTLPPIQVNPNR